MYDVMANTNMISVTDLNGAELNPADLETDEIVGYIKLVKNLNSDLGTSKDYQGYNDYLNFKKNIEEADISTFTAKVTDEIDSYASVDLTGQNVVIANFDSSWYYTNYQNQMIMMCAMNMGLGITPFDMQNSSLIERDGRKYFMPEGVGVTPYSAMK